MRGSYQWAILRLAILAVFVIPAALMQPAPTLLHGSAGWLAAVDATAPVLALHQSDNDKLQLTPEVVQEVRDSAVRAARAQEQAMRALRQELARELVRVRAEQAQRHVRS
ncbi:MAG: hypothetical protein ACK4E7_06420 [Permianibacter sp.]